MIDIKNVSKSFGTKKAVDDIHFQVPSGSITGFIGPNGAGKTTTIHMMTGALGIDQGEILLNGIDIAKNPIQAKREFGLVPDSPDLFLWLSAREYINFMADIYQIDQSLRDQRIGQLAKDFQIESDLDQPLSSFSHGMRQKAIIIGALVCDPNIWILDEPMTGLDPESAFLLKEKMKEHAQKGNTVFFSTHVLEVAEKLCDQIVIINKGKICFDGTLDSLKEKFPNQSLEEIFLEVISNA